ncbi:alpha-hydroxy acid oxidase [Thermodesulfobacteriota bacterium]
MGNAAELLRMLVTSRRPKGMMSLNSVEEVKRLARRRLPKMIFDFVEGGAEDEQTLAANYADFRAITYRPRVLVDVSKRRTDIKFLGKKLLSPVLLAPAGLARLVHPDGEIAAARAAHKAGTVFALSTGSSWSLEEVAEAAEGPLWFQLYLWGDREVIASMLERADHAGYEALVLTVDVPIVGKRDRDLRNAMSVPPRVTLQNFLEVCRKPLWLRTLLKGPPVTFRNFLGMAEGDDAVSLSTYANRELINPASNWDDLDWIRTIWKGPLLIKGITTAEDAREAVAHGAEGIIVSNHGGRQLDGAPSAIRSLAEISNAVGNKIDLMIDGGITRGSDVVKAICLGAKAVMIGRPWFWGLAAGGEEGVSRVLEILDDEISRVLALTGRTEITDLDRSLVNVPSYW